LVQDFRGISWSGVVMTKDTKFKCLNPYGDHSLRYCRVEVDGFLPPSDPFYYWHNRLVLCSLCAKKNESRIFRRRWFGWLGYLPDIY
jgi:hypothetical protein